MNESRSSRSKALIRVGVLLVLVGACFFVAMFWAAGLPVNPDGTRQMEGGTTIKPEFFGLVGQFGGGIGGVGLVVLLLGLVRRN